MNRADATVEAQNFSDNIPAASLETVAEIAKSWDIVHRPTSRCTFFARARNTQRALKDLEAKLLRKQTEVIKGSRTNAQCTALLELGTCYRLMRSAVGVVTDDRRRVSRLPRIVLGAGVEEPRIATIVGIYLDAVNGVFSAESFGHFLRAIQSYEALNVEELWCAGAFLRYTLLELLVDSANHLLAAEDPATAAVLLNLLHSLRAVSNSEWGHLVQPLIAFDGILCQDPAEKYEQMDFESRELYRRRIAFIARFSDYSESQIAQTALELARQQEGVSCADSRAHYRRLHVGYYLIDKGFALLAGRVGFHPSVGERVRDFARAHDDDVYITTIEVLTALIVAAVLFPLIPVMKSFTGLALGIIALLLPASQTAVDFVNALICALFKPEPLPKLDFRKGIPADCATLVAVPTLLLNEQQVRGLVNDLEVRFLGNRDPYVHFALLTDLPDSATKPREEDAHPLVNLAIALIDGLNKKYRGAEIGSFMLLHRHRVFNRRQKVWMGWERKRGKLLDLNSLLCGENDAFPIKAGPTQMLGRVRYVLTLDSDTQLPRGTVSRLVGAMAHPLNQAVIDSRSRIVTEGYGILQPRIGITVRATSRSRLASIYSGQNGLDIYSRATSDAYQDFFEEGIYTGKGIYEVATLHAVLKNQFPRNALLSHDLIEGAYARAGLATDIELFDDYPSHYSAYSRRKHRWVRGDWQIARWMFSRVPNEAGQSVPNPISLISRWKILDNLRRSLVPPFFFLLIVAGWFRLAGGPRYWTIASLLLLISPALIQLAFNLGIALNGPPGRAREALADFERSAFVTFIDLILLAHQMLLALDAVIRSFTRLLITGEALLEWESAAQAEFGSTRKAALDWYLSLTPLLAAGVGLLLWMKSQNPVPLFWALPILALWALAFPVTAWLDAPPRARHSVDTSDEEFLMEQAMLIWRYFHQFGNERHNFLIPDNVQEENLCDAPRVSPTNIGLLLNARQSAFELGFLTLPELADLTSRSLATIARLEKYRNHLYNWYDTHSLAPLKGATYVSSVDSGNFVASLYTLRAGMRHLSQRAMISPALLSSLRLSWRAMVSGNKKTTALVKFHLPAHSAPLDTWIEWLPAAHAILAKANEERSTQNREDWSIAQTKDRVRAILNLLHDYLPWVLPEFRPLRSVPQLEFDEKSTELSLRDAAVFAEALNIRLSRNWEIIVADPSLLELGEKLRSCLPAAASSLRNLEARLSNIERESGALADGTDFSFLVDPDRQLLSISYDTETGRLHNSCYDMMASEARIATLLAIARGDLPQRSWFKLSRDHAYVNGRFILLSWTGTMFEYLMPSLWMRSYAGTLIARSQENSVYVQRSFARAHGVPWGISESGSSGKNECGDYHYEAYGIPQVALSFAVTAGPVISPYSSFLALGVDSREAIRNLRRMAHAGWVGPFGFYESIDYSINLRVPVVTREWMAHHQGMSLLAILNLLRDNVVQRWFHANPVIQSAELLLHERPISKGQLKAKMSQLASMRPA
jgi:cyclic beta-1,2-glucan glucanotransferase